MTPEPPKPRAHATRERVMRTLTFWLRPEFVLRRAAGALAPPASVQLSMRADTLVGQGMASGAWLAQALA